MAAFLPLPLLLPACSVGRPEEGSARLPGPQLSTPGKLPLVAEPVTLTVFVPSVGFVEDFKTNAYAKWVEEQTGVRIEWIESDKVDARNKLSALLASGAYPDIIFGANGTGLASQDLYRYGRQGVFIPLNRLIEEQGFWIKDLFAAEPAFKRIVTSPDGNIYGLPAVFTDDYHMTMRQKFWINQRWLDRLGLPLPTTTEEFFRVMVAFKDLDANGDGRTNDEIPMTGAKRNMEDLALWVMSAFVPAGGQDDSGDAFLNNYEFIVDDGVFFSADKREFREGLRFLRRMYLRGLFDVSALTQDRSQIRPFVEGPVNRVGGVASHHPANFTALSDDPGAPIREYVAVPPLRGPAGRASTPWFIDAVIKPGEFAITDRCRHPELAFRWADHFYRLESALHDKGVEGVHWERIDSASGLVALNGKPAKYRYLKPLSKEDNAQINMGPGWTRDLKNEFARAPGFSYEEFLYNSTKLYDPRKVRRYPYATVSIADRDFAEFNELRRTIHTYVAEATDRFIIGDLDIDAEWDAYVAQLDRIGLGRYLKILEDNL
jgi:putative aldouronate transport system substrate-binding protein